MDLSVFLLVFYCVYGNKICLFIPSCYQATVSYSITTVFGKRAKMEAKFKANPFALQAR